jgi:hypothetical protein
MSPSCERASQPASQPLAFTAMGRDWPAKAQGQQDLLRYTLRAHCMEQCELARGWKKTVDGGFEAKRRECFAKLS